LAGVAFFAAGLATGLAGADFLAAGLATGLAGVAFGAGFATFLAAGLVVVFLAGVLMVLLSEVEACGLAFELPSKPVRKPRFLPLSVALAIENLQVGVKRA
jgi:hypothetical protein